MKNTAIPLLLIAPRSPAARAAACEKAIPLQCTRLPFIYRDVLTHQHALFAYENRRQAAHFRPCLLIRFPLFCAPEDRRAATPALRDDLPFPASNSPAPTRRFDGRQRTMLSARYFDSAGSFTRR